MLGSGIGAIGLAHGSELGMTGAIDAPGDTTGTISTDGSGIVDASGATTDGSGIIEPLGAIDASGLPIAGSGHGRAEPTGAMEPGMLGDSDASWASTRAGPPTSVVARSTAPANDRRDMNCTSSGGSGAPHGQADRFIDSRTPSGRAVAVARSCQVGGSGDRDRRDRAHPQWTP